MISYPSAFLRAFWLGIVLLCCSPPARAEQFGLFTFRVLGGVAVQITDYPEDAVGAVIIPDEIAGLPVTSIDEWAFFRCTGLTSVTFPVSLASIGGAAFFGCSALTGIVVEPANPNFSSVGNIVFNQALTRLILCPGGKTGACVIPASVTSIGENAFMGCSGLTSVTIPDSVTSIGAVAFGGCSGLAGIVIPSSVTSLGEDAFSDCGGLASVSLPLRVGSVSKGLFAGCGRLTSVQIPSSVTSIGDMAFRGCAGLTSIQIPDSVTSIGQMAFETCVNLDSVHLPGSVTSIGFRAFNVCTALTSVSLPASLTGIDPEAFSSCTALTSVTVPDGVQRLGGGAFSFCSNLERVVLPETIADIGNYAFWGCTRLRSASFLGNAPSSFGDAVFDSSAADFTIHYLSRRTGFTSPTWRGYPATMIDESSSPAAPWLLEHGLWYDTDLHQDADGDGVSLLMAYALDLDPRLNLRSSLPVPVLAGNALSLSFHAASPGVSYRVEVSGDLQHWTGIDVTPSAPGQDQRITVAVPVAGPSRFMRLAVEY